MEHRLPKKLPKTPFVPRWVAHATAADQIRYHYSERRVPVPKSLKTFLDSQIENLGYNWEFRIMELLGESRNPETIKQWLKIFPPGMARAEIRGLLKEVENGRDAGLQ